MTAVVGAWSRARCVKMKPDWNGMTPGGAGRPLPSASGGPAAGGRPHLEREGSGGEDSVRAHSRVHRWGGQPSLSYPPAAPWWWPTAQSWNQSLVWLRDLLYVCCTVKVKSILS